MKSMWRFLTVDTIWSQIVCDKYLNGEDKSTWFLRSHRSFGVASPVWRGLLETRQWILPGLSWDIGSGSKIHLNELFFDSSMERILSPELVEFFRIKGYSSLSHLCSHSPSLSDYWRGSNFFHLNGNWKSQWDRFTAALYRFGISLTQDEDRLIWMHSPNGSITAKLAYS